MSQPNETAIPAESPPALTMPLDGQVREHADGIGLDPTGEEAIDRRLARIEMAGEEVAAGWKPGPHEPLAPEVRYLHISRTIHELISDRNRSVGIFLFVASLLFGASTALLGAPKEVAPIIPLAAIQYWCLPVTAIILAVIGAFVSLILIRSRIGLIFEVTKMNTLLGLPSRRVERVKPLSIFFLMHALVVLLGGASAGFAAGMLAWRTWPRAGTAIGLARIFHPALDGRRTSERRSIFQAPAPAPPRAAHTAPLTPIDRGRFEPSFRAGQLGAAAGVGRRPVSRPYTA